ncbi:MAG TPA: GNAT family N-acetyltransferase [Anaerolineales bacterium]|nr:GNAT family N-acetyltransferase [Anaerolineales bacterium]
MAASVQIRQFQYPQDYQPVYDLWSSIEKGVHVGRSDTPVEIEKKIGRDPDLFLVAVCDEQIIGSVIGGYDGRRGLIYHLAVSASFRGQGIGSRLMDAVESRLRAKGCLKSYLLVAEDNREAEAYYQHRGWKPMNTVHLFGKDLA